VRSVLLILVTTLGACVEPFDGSKLEILLRAGVQVPGDEDPGSGRPPSDTHYELYAVRDDSAFLLHTFQVIPVIRQAEPCFMEDEQARFPGLHATQIARKLIEAAMVDGTVSDDEAGVIAVAEDRLANLNLLEQRLKIIAFAEPGLTGAVVAQFRATLPAPDLIDDASNANRLSLCRAFMRQHPGYYVGNDKTLAIPLAGRYEGVIEGTDPRNGAFLGGGSFDVEVNLASFDALRINWNFNDPADPRRAALPPSEIGWHYMSGKPVQRTRGVWNVPMQNRYFSPISGELTVWYDLAEDSVHF
jgi:hypothetical protein